jgi:hypothetical protein
MKGRGWGLILAGVGVFATVAPAMAAGRYRSGGVSYGVGARYRSGNLAVNLGYSSSRYYGSGYYGGYGPGRYYHSGYYGGYGAWPYYGSGYYYAPRRYYGPGYYGGYFSVYPAYGYGYPVDDFPIYDFPVYPGLPLIPIGYLSPYWAGWHAPLRIWPSLYGLPTTTVRPAAVVELPPKERVEDRPLPPAPLPETERGERPADGERGVSLGRLRMERADGDRVRVQWIGDPRVIDRLVVEEQDGERRRVRTHEVAAYPFRAAFTPEAKTQRLRVRALGAGDAVAEAVFDVRASTGGERARS